MEVEDALRALGGAARWQELRGHVGWRALKKAKKAGSVELVNGVWRLADADQARILAAQLRATRSHSTAAAHWGMDLPPQETPETTLTVPPTAHRRNAPTDVNFRYRRLDRTEIDGDVTTPLRTVVDCLRDEPLRVALSVGDSALREGLVTHRDLTQAVANLTGQGAAKAKHRLGLLDARSANAFESCARAILIEAGIDGFEPQVPIRGRRGFIGRVDFAHRGLRIVIECDGFETHGGREAFVKDLIRFTYLVSEGWRPLRFTWEQVMFSSDWVLERVRDTIADAEAGRRFAA